MLRGVSRVCWRRFASSQATELPAELDEPAEKKSVRDKRNDESWKAKRDYVRAVVEAHLERTPNPMVSRVVQRSMYELHKTDEALWTPDKIARTFGMPRDLCKSILEFMKLEDNAFPSGTQGTVFDNSVEEMLEAKFGVQLPSRETKIALRTERFVSPQFEFVDELEGSLQEYGWKTQAARKIDNVPREELGAEPSKEWAGFKDSVEVLPPSKSGVQRKFRVVLVDTSKRYRDEERPIVVEEVDTSIRTADWTERRTLMTLHRARRRKMKNNLRGTLAMEVLLDVDKFYLDDAVVGLPDYWPNNARPALGNFDRLVSRLNKLPHWTDLKNRKPKAKEEPKTSESGAEAAAGAAVVAESAEAVEKITEKKA